MQEGIPGANLPYQCPHPFQLDMRKLVKACSEAYEEGRLGYQLEQGRAQYRYSDEHPNGKPCGCAIGVGLPDNIMPWVNQSLTVVGNQRPNGPFVIPENPDEFSDLKNLQYLHDNICAHIFNDAQDTRQTAEGDFEAFLTDMERKYPNAPTPSTT